MDLPANVSLLYRRRLVGVILGRFLVAFLVPFLMLLRHGGTSLLEVGSALPFQVLLVIGIVNILYLVLLQSGALDRGLWYFGLIQTIVDVLIAGGITYLTGGIHSWLVPLLFLPVLEAGWLLTGTTAVLCASLGAIALACSAIIYQVSLRDFDYQQAMLTTLGQHLREMSPPLVDGALWLEDQAADLPLTTVGVASRVVQQVIALYIVAFLVYAGSVRGREELLAGILQHMRDGVLVCDRSRRVIFCNQAARRDLGIHPGAVLEGMQVERVRVASGREELLQMVRRALEDPHGAGGTLGIFQAPGNQEAAGQCPVIEVKRIPVHGRRSPQATLIRFEDITERMRTVDAQQRADRLRSAGIMATGLAHEVRNPLAAIRAAAQELRQQGVGPDRASLLELVIRESDRLDGIVGSVLAFARQRVPVREWVDLRQAIEEMVELLHLPAERQISVDIHVWPGLEVWADPTQLRQMLLNLARNAVEALPAQGGSMVLEAFEVEQQPGWVCLRVRDDGSGIPLETRERVGTPFFTTKDQGTGMGLPIAMKMVEDHGGTLEIDGLPGKGTVVTVLLPHPGRAGSREAERHTGGKA